MNKKIIAIIAIGVIIIVAITAFAIIQNSKGNKSKGETQVEESKQIDLENLTGKHHVEINVKDYGKMEVEVDADAAPITVKNFLKLVQEKFYDGLTFHRIIDGFMIQGGDPTGTGSGGSEEKIKGEFSSNGIENPISHKRGVISMARSSDKDSASSQFFIMQLDDEELDGDYAAFGEVKSGIEIVDKICENTKVEDRNGTVKKENQPVIENIIIID